MRDTKSRTIGILKGESILRQRCFTNEIFVSDRVDITITDNTVPIAVMYRKKSGGWNVLPITASFDSKSIPPMCDIKLSAIMTAEDTALYTIVH